MGKFVQKETSNNENDSGNAVHNNKTNIVAILLIIIGAGILLFGLIYYISEKSFELNTQRTTAKIIKIEKYYDNSRGSGLYLCIDVYVEFYVDGKQYTGKLNYYVKGMYEGQEIEICYDENNPNDFQPVGGLIEFILFIPLFGLLVLIGGIKYNKLLNSIE